MLEENYSEQLTHLQQKLPSQISLPAEWSDFFAEDGVVASIQNDQRRFVRHRFRTKGVLELNQSLPAIEREFSFHHIYTRDLSRSGVSFVYADQLYPGEVCRLWLPAKKVNAYILQCRRYNENCYVAGASFEPIGFGD